MLYHLNSSVSLAFYVYSASQQVIYLFFDYPLLLFIPAVAKGSVQNFIESMMPFIPRYVLLAAIFCSLAASFAESLKLINLKPETSYTSIYLDYGSNKTEANSNNAQVISNCCVASWDRRE